MGNMRKYGAPEGDRTIETEDKRSVEAALQKQDEVATQTDQREGPSDKDDSKENS